MSTKLPVVLLALLVILTNILAFSPILHSPYLGDDSWRESTIRGVCSLCSISLSEITWGALTDSVKSGRWYPLVFYYYPVFYYLDLDQYKLAGLVFILINMMLFGWMVRLITGSWTLALISGLLLPVSLQLHFYHDAVLSYYFLMQLEFSLIMLSIICFILYLRKPSPLLMIVAAASYTTCVLIYEAFYALWIIHAILAYSHFGKRSAAKVFRTILPILIPAAVSFFIMLLIRVQFGVSYEGVTLRLAPLDWLSTLGKQLFAAVPLSHMLTTFTVQETYMWTAGSGGAALIGVCALWGLVWLLTSRSAIQSVPDNSPHAIRELFWVGLALWILPAPAVAFSAKYQDELRWGIGYLPVYVSTFGILLMLLLGITLLYEPIRKLPAARRRIMLGFVAIVGCAVCGINYANNRMVVDRYNLAELWPRKIIETAMNLGLLDVTPASSILICDEPMRSWDNASFYAQHSGLTLQVVKPPGFPHDKEQGSQSIREALAGFEVDPAEGLYDFKGPSRSAAAFSGYIVQFKSRGWPLLGVTRNSAQTTQNSDVYLLRYGAWSEGFGYAVLARFRGLKSFGNEIVPGCR